MADRCGFGNGHCERNTSIMNEETAWVLEREDPDNPGCTTGGCLGVFTTPHFAIRFCRKQDAEMAAPFLMSGVKMIAIEHEWDMHRVKEISQKRTCEECGKEYEHKYFDHAPYPRPPIRCSFTCRDKALAGQGRPVA